MNRHAYRGQEKGSPDGKVHRPLSYSREHLVNTRTIAVVALVIAVIVLILLLM